MTADKLLKLAAQYEQSCLSGLVKKAKIRKLPNGKYRVLSEKGKNMGTYDSREGAKKRLRAVEYFKQLSIMARLMTNQLLTCPTLTSSPTLPLFANSVRKPPLHKFGIFTSLQTAIRQIGQSRLACPRQDGLTNYHAKIQQAA